MKTKLLNALKVSSLALILSFGVSYALAWTAPTLPPPTGNVSAPLNTSATGQTKVGQLIVGSLNAGAGTIQTTGFLSGQILTNSITFADLTTMSTAPSASVPHGKQRFTTVGVGVCPSATNCWTAPAGVTKVWVSMSGGGGGGDADGWGPGIPGTASSFSNLLVKNGGGAASGVTVGLAGGPGGARGGSSIFGGIYYGYGGGGVGNPNGGGAAAGIAEEIAVIPSTPYPITVGAPGYHNSFSGPLDYAQPGFVLVEW